MTQADKLVRLTQQLVGDISRLPGVVLDSGGEAQLVQLLTDAFEQVGEIAIDGSELQFEQPPCRCGGKGTCPSCVEAYRRHPEAQAKGEYQGFHLRKCFDPACSTDHYTP